MSSNAARTPVSAHQPKLTAGAGRRKFWRGSQRAASGGGPGGGADRGRLGRGPSAPERLARFLDSEAGRVLIVLSVYREPVDRNAVLFQAGLHDWAAAGQTRSGSLTPPYRADDDLAGLLASCVGEGYLNCANAEGADAFLRGADHLGSAGRVGSGSRVGGAGGGTGRDAARPNGMQPGGEVMVGRPVAGQVRELVIAAGREAELTAAHRRAAQYWQWRAAAWPQDRHADIHDLLEARQHLLLAGDLDPAGELTEVICAQLRAWGDLVRATELIRGTLEAMPSPSAGRAHWLYELAATAQGRGDYVAAERLYHRAVRMFAQVDGLAGTARGLESLGVLAQARGDYRKAERHYRAAADAERRCRDAGGTAFDYRPDAPGHARGAGSESLSQAANALGEHESAGLYELEDEPGVRNRRRRPRDPFVVAALALAAVMVAATGAGALHLTAFTTPDGQGGKGGGPGTAANRGSAADRGDGQRRTASTVAAAGVRGASAARRRAADWVLGQVKRGAVISCDPAMCALLRAGGMPAGDLLVLGPGAQADPLGSDIVVATAAVRSQLGARLADVYAPLVAAGFGTGSARIEIRITAADGAVAYRRALRADTLARAGAGAELLKNKALRVTPAARRALAGGRVDSRTLATIAALAGMWRIQVLGFGDGGPGAGPMVPLRSAELTVAGPGQPDAAGAAGPLRGIATYLRAQQPPYLSAGISLRRLSDGRAVLRFFFAAPCPLGLLAGTGPPPEAGIHH